jgi:DNA-binding HxlR family transcriptional regulator
MTEAVANSTRTCDASLTRAFGVLGKRWNGMILSVLSDGPASFSEVRRAVGGITDSVLSDRLTELAGLELVRRSVSEGPPVSVHYELTDGGRALLPVLDQLGAWAHTHLEHSA